MIQLLVISILAICFYFSFIVYCALVNKKPMPSPGQNLGIKGACDHESIGCGWQSVIADTIQETLENDCLDVMSAKDGMDGYSTYLRFKPDMIITDIQMPRKNGLEMMKRIRTHNPMIKTIYMSGNIGSFETLLIEEKKRYPVSYFKKPFSLESLMRVVTEPTVN